MYGDRTANVIRLQRAPDGVATNLRTRLCAGRTEIVTAGPNPEFGFIGSDPYESSAYTGLVVPTTPTSQLGGRYMMVLARARFSDGEQGVRLTGIRQYAEMIARVPNGFGGTDVFRREIRSPLWHPPDGALSWHVMVISHVQRDTRNPQNTDGVRYEDSLSPALLYETLAGTSPFGITTYTPPNGGRPWGRPMAASLGNIHELRYRWRTDQSEQALDIPVPLPSDVLLVVSARQNDPATNPSDVGTPAVVTGDVDLTTLVLPGALTGKSLAISINAFPSVVTFIAPVTVADVLAQINAVINPTAAATTNADNFLVITTTANGASQSLQVTGVSAVAPLGLAVMTEPNTGTNPLTANQFAALSHEDQFLTAYHTVAQYGVVAGALVFKENLGEDVP